MDPFSHEFHADPYPVYRWMRDHAPVYRNPDGWYALSRYDDVLAASQQPLAFSSAKGTSLELIDSAAMLPMIIFMDPPQHDRQRKLVSRVFTPRAISDLEPFVRATAVQLLDELDERGGGDFVQEFSAILPMNVIMELLGVPEADRNQVRHWMDASLDRVEEPPYIPQHAIDAMTNAVGYWSSLVADKRAHPDDALASRLCEVEATDDDGAPIRLGD